MDTIREHINIVYVTSLMSKNHFIGKHQDEMIRFVYCGVQKTCKVSLAVLQLYPQLSKYEDLEFPLGILLRSLLMDMILVMGIKKIYTKYDGSNKDKLKIEIKNYCLKVLNDGTKHLLEEVDNSKKYSEDQKNEYYQKLTFLFSDAFDFSKEKPTLKNQYRLSLNDIYKNSNDPGLVTNEPIYNLYSYYSKYDHLSHWTSLSQKTSFVNRKSRLERSIILMVMHLRELLTIAYDFDTEYKILDPYIKDLNDHLEKYIGSKKT